MKALALYFCGKSLLEKEGKNQPCTKLAEVWEVAGILHDADYEITKDDPEKHTKLVAEWVGEAGGPQEIIDAILAHGWGYVKSNPKPSNKMQWSLYCCDELTGLIVAVALVRPDRKLSSVTVDSVLGKWNSKSFAAGVDRKQIEMCEKELGIPLKEFINISLEAMQEISSDLGL